jgi:methylated-DNA-protein-cysteine methyltransferase related protein
MSTGTRRDQTKTASALTRNPRKRTAKSSSSWGPIYKLVKQIPRGSVITYGGVAKKLRLRGGARVVGYAMAGCPSGSGIPWHRVIGAGGHLRLSEPLVSLQRKLLESEGVQFIERRVDIDRHLWRRANRSKSSSSKRTGSRRQFA